MGKESPRQAALLWELEERGVTADEALQRWVDQKDDLLAGRKPGAKWGGITVRELCNRFLTAKDNACSSGELSRETWQDYLQTCKRLAEFSGDRLVEDLRGDDFDELRASFATTNGLDGLKNKINRTRIVFKYAHNAGLIEHPVQYGANFKRPSSKAIRRQRTPQMYEADEIRRMLAAATPTWQALTHHRPAIASRREHGSRVALR